MGSCCNSCCVNSNIQNIVPRLSVSNFGRNALGSGILNNCLCCVQPRQFAPDVAAYAHYNLMGAENLINYDYKCCMLSNGRYLL